MTWNFRIIYHDKDEYPWYGVHEVFYNEDGNIYTYTENAMDLTGETEEYVKSYVDMVQKDINRSPILVESEIILAKPDYELDDDGKTFDTIEELINDLNNEDEIEIDNWDGID